MKRRVTGSTGAILVGGDKVLADAAANHQREPERATTTRLSSRLSITTVP